MTGGMLIQNFVSSAGKYRQVRPDEWAGPCPFCHEGEDRFKIWPQGGKKGVYYWCRQCKASGDGIQFLREFMGYSYSEACAAFGIEAKRYASGLASFAPGRRNRFSTAKQAQSKRETQAPARAEYPGQEWQAAAQAFLSSCRVEPVRGLTAETCGACGIFTNPADRYPERTEWGLAPYTDGNGKEHTKTLIPRGIVIATRRKAGLVALTVRCLDDDRETKKRPKFWEVKGGAQVPFFAGAAGVPVVLVESAIDAALVWQASGGRLAGVALMGSTKDLDAGTDEFLRAAPALIAAPDFDAAGAKGGRRWLERFPQAIYFPPLEGKDLGERPDLCPVWCELAIEEVEKGAGEKAEKKLEETPESLAAVGQKLFPVSEKKLDALPVPYAPDMLDGRPVCYLPQETPERLRGILPPDLQGLGVPMEGLPLSLRGLSACGWRPEFVNGRLELRKARADARNAEGVAAYMSVHSVAVAEDWQRWKAWEKTETERSKGI